MEYATFVLISLLLSATLIVLSELLRPKPKFENARPAGLGDFRFPTAVEGRPVPLLWGTVKIDGPNIVWWGDLTQVPIKQKFKTGLWSSKTVTTGFKYSAGLQFAFCRGPVTKLTRVWVGETEVFSGSLSSEGATANISKLDLYGADDLGNGGIEGTLRLHLGSETQGRNAYLQGVLGATNLPAYRGTCYAVWEHGYLGNSTSIKPFAFELARLPNPLAIPSGHHVVNAGLDLNPITALYELLTDTDWGFGFPTSFVDAVNFRAAAETLFTEGNGLSLIWDTARDAVELKRELERQINGICYFDMTDGVFRVQLTRADYNIDDVPQLLSGAGGNVLEISDFSRGTWDETTNQILVQFYSRASSYAETFARAADLANQRIQDGRIVVSTSQFPGVKDPALASSIATRGLRGLSTPLAKANLIVDRSLWELHVGQVVAWTDAEKGFEKMAFRVLQIDYGSLLNGQIALNLIQDVFGFTAGIFGEPQETLWQGPSQAVAPFPANEQLAIEAPWALVRRDPTTPGVMDRLFAAGRAQTGAEITFQVFERNAAGSPSGTFNLNGEVAGFMLVGALRAGLGAGTANPAATIGLDPSPDSVARLLAAFPATTPAQDDIGQNLLNLLMVDGEFLAVSHVLDQTTYVDLKDVYRGFLDSAPAAHSAGAKVYLIFVGAGLGDSPIAPGNNVEVKLRPRSRTDQVAEVAATTISLQMKNRCRRPYPPVSLGLNAAGWPATVNFDDLRGGGSTPDDRGIVASYLRRDYWTYDEVKGLLTDAGTLDTSFPHVNATCYKIRVTKDPAGSPVVLFTTALNDGSASIFLSRTKILRYTSGARPLHLRVEVTAHHTFESVEYDALQVLSWDFDTSASTLDDDTNMGVLPVNTGGAVYTAPTSGTYTFTLGTVLATGNVEYRKNGGAWTVVIAAGATSGTVLAVVAADTLEVRHTQAGSAGLETFLGVDAPASSVDAYAILTY